jgi:adenine phosphoribosyltransferase
MNDLDPYLLKPHIKAVADFPKPGILFYDISTLLAHSGAWHKAINALAAKVADFQPDLLVGIESRGFLTAAPLALHLNCGFVMVRKKGKLPGPVVSHEYTLEYGTDIIQIQQDAIKPGQKVVVLDDLLATGGTLSATVHLLRKIGADVRGAACIIELLFLEGRKRLDVPVETLIRYKE